MRTTHFIKGLLTSGLLALYSAVMAGGGPSKPEAAQFEPIDVSDMVNLFSGDFSYSVPLVEVPGPEGNWPINLAYHAGIGPNTDPTWVGLGWTLNPGAINRFPSGFADDWYGGMTTSMYKDKGGRQKGYGLGFGWGPFGLNAQFVDGKGFQGISATVSLGASIGKLTGIDALENFNIGGTIGFGSNQQGLSASISGGYSKGLGESGLKLGGNFSLSSDGSVGGGLGLSADAYKDGEDYTNSLSLAGVSFSSNQQGGSFSLAGAGFRSGSSGPTGGYKSKSSSWGFSIPLPFKFDISLSGYEVKWWLFETNAEGGFGVLHQGGYLDDNIREYWYQQNAQQYKDLYELSGVNMTKEETNETANSTQGYWGIKRFDRIEGKDYLLPGEDIYSVSVMGASGAFKPHFEFPFEIKDGAKQNEKGQFQEINGQYNKKQNIQFRYLSDPATNYIMDASSLGVNGYQNMYNKPYQSKYIIPTMDQETGLITGFTIIAEDGKIYEFMKPVLNYMTSNIYRKGSFTNQQDVFSPYATSWLLTGVKGPDYIDSNSNGLTDEGDFGFWFKFNYADDGDLIWRTPSLPGSVTPLAENATQWSWGIRDNIRLESIESETHKAVFVVKGSANLETEGVESGLDFYAGLVTRTPDDSYHLAKFAINKRVIKRLLQTYNLKLRFEYNANDGKRHLRGDISSDLLTNTILNTYGYKINSRSLKSGYSSNETYLGAVARNYDLTSFTATGTAAGTDTNLGANEPLEVIIDWDPDGWDLDRVKLTFVTTDGTPVIKKQGSETNWVRKKLIDKIVVYNKYSRTGNPQIVNGVRFGHAFRLKSGAASLYSLQFFGKDETSLIPGTVFGYSSYNPDFNTHSYDFWNHYSSVANDTTHKNSQIQNDADRDASAWNLTEISTPLGSKIKITYESDRINTVGVSSLETNAAEIISPQTDVQTNTITLLNSITGFNVNDQIRITDTYTYLTFVEDSTFQEIDGIWYWVDASYYLENTGVVDIGEGQIVSISGNAITLNKSFILNADNLGENDLVGRNHSYYLKNLSNTIYQGEGATGGVMFGGGHRVKRVDLVSSFQSTYQNYEYGPGVTPCLPSGLKKSYPNYPDNIFVDHDFNQIGPSPGVGYEWVTVTTRDLQGNVLNGRVRTSFYTAKDAKYITSSTTTNGITRVRIDDLSGIIGRQKKIEEFAQKEKSNGQQESDYYLISETSFEYRYSKMKSLENGITKSLESDSDGSQRKIIMGKTADNQFVFNADTTKPFGLTSQTVRSIKDGKTNIITLNRHNVYMLGTTTTKYNYNRAGQQVGAPFVVKTRIMGFDARTGNSLINIAWDSRNRQLVSESYPAYLFYDGMKANNMMTQPALTKGYQLPANENYWNLTGTSAIKQYLMSSELTTWKDWNLDPQKSVWRQNDQYKAIKIGSAYSEPSPSILNLADEISSPASFDFVYGWQRTSNITRYDDYGHPIEERGLDGNYTSSVYAYKSSLPVAIATNAKHYSGTAGMGNEFSSGDFEDIRWVDGTRRSDQFNLYNEPQNKLDSLDAHSGRFSVYVKHNSGSYSYSPGGDFLPDDQNRKFQVSCWVKTDNGFGSTGNAYLVIHSANPTSPGIQYPAPAVYLPITDTKGEWKFFSSVLDLGKIRKQYNIPAGTKLSIRVFVEHRHTNKGLYVDDFRFHPVDAAVSSFTYDPVTWKVSSITDQNNTTSYFEYDAIGRLIIVRDQNKNIVNMYRYNYGKMTK